MSVDYLEGGKYYKRAKEALSEYYSSEQNEKLETIDIQNIIQRPFSTVAFLQANTTKNTYLLVMKTISQNPINKVFLERENQADNEFNILSMLYPEFTRITDCSVPKPVLVLPEIDTYIMEMVDGSLLLDRHIYDRYFSSIEEFKILQKSYFNIGKWLKNFQAFTGINASDRTSLIEVIDRCQHRLKLIEESKDRRCPKSFRSDITNLMQEQFDLLSSEDKILVSGRHGDFGPWNILANNSEIIVIDFMGYGKEPIMIDVLKILVFLENEKNALTSSSRRIKLLKDSFLKGYGRANVIPKPAYNICEIMQRVVSIWGSIEATPKQVFHHRLESNNRIKSHIKKINEITQH